MSARKLVFEAVDDGPTLDLTITQWRRVGGVWVGPEIVSETAVISSLPDADGEWRRMVARLLFREL